MKKILILLLLIWQGTLMAQPLLPEWGGLLMGIWRVERMDTTKIPEGVNMFLEFQEDKLLMHNQKSIKEAAWKVLEAERQVLIKSEGNNVEAWSVKYIDSTNLAIYDTLGNATLYMVRYDGPLKNGRPTLDVKVTVGDLIGTWLLTNIANAPIPNVNLTMDIQGNGQLLVKIGSEVQRFRWQLNEGKTRLRVYAEEKSKPIEWIFTQSDNNHLSFIDQGNEMNFARYVAPVMPEQEAMLLGKWRIIEVANEALPKDGPARYMQLDANGKMSFHTNDKKEGDGSWGLDDKRSGIFIVSGGGNERWKILSLSKEELLVEMEDLKMLLRKQ